MNSSLPTLTSDDVERLARDHSIDARIEIVSKLVRMAEQGRLAGHEQGLLLDVLGRLARDAAMQVREAVAWQLYNSPLLSDDLAETLAQDVISVAFPILRHAPDLPDRLLLDIIDRGQADRQLAIAARNRLSAAVCAVLADVDNVAVLATLAGNNGAEIAEETLLALAERHADGPLVAEPLAARGTLPARVIERLVASMSLRVRDLLVERHGLSPVIAAEVAGHGRDAAMQNLLRPLSRAGLDLSTVICQLEQAGRLSVPLMLRLLCAGDFDFFASAIAAKSRVSQSKAMSLLLGGKWEGLRALLEHAHVPRHVQRPFQVAQRAANDLGYHGGDAGRESFQTAALGQIYSECGQSEERAMDDLLLQLFDQKGDALIDQAMELAGIPFLPLRGAVPR